MLYVDTSLLVSALTNEAETKNAQDWLNARQREMLAISDWVTTEFSAALSIKLRTRQITPAQRAETLAFFSSGICGSVAIFPVTGAQFRTAATFADQYALGLRAGDALHLAIAADHGATLCTLDRRLADAGGALGVTTLLL
jgi:predicted nucleic acid-binding protein